MKTVFALIGLMIALHSPAQISNGSLPSAISQSQSPLPSAISHLPLMDLSWPVLQTSGRSFTNAHLGTITAAWVTVLDDTGGARVPMTNLPDWLQKKLNYNPTNAAALFRADAAKKEKERAAALERQKLIAKLRGPVQTVRLVSVIDDYGQCVITTTNGQQTVYMMSLPENAKNFLIQYAALKQSYAQLQTTPITVTATANNTGDEVFDSQMAASDALYQARIAREDQLERMKQNLKEFGEEQFESTTFRAFNTGLKDNNVARWQAQ